ncbi:MAG TPA: hypothetical protein VGL53_10210 [Bryobacteraceae bacterium]
MPGRAGDHPLVDAAHACLDRGHSPDRMAWRLQATELGTQAMTKEDYGAAYLKHFRGTVKLLTSRGVVLEAAEEASQAAWARGWEYLHQLRDKRLLITWVNTIALNCYRKTLRNTKRSESMVDVAGSCSIDMACLDLAKILKLCDEPNRKLLQQRLAGLTINEIASDLGTTSLAVRVRLNRARRKAYQAVVAAPGSCSGKEVTHIS